MRAWRVCTVVLFALIGECQTAADLDALSRAGVSAAAAGDFQRAADFFRRGAEAADAARNPKRALSFWSMAGACHLSLHGYADALRCFTQAKARALKTSDPAATAALAANLSTLYLQIGDWNAASAAADFGLAHVGPWTRYLPELQLQRAMLRAAAGDLAGGEAGFATAASTADLMGDPQALTLAWDQIAWLEMERGDLHAAEEHLIRSFRLRLLLRMDTLDGAYRNLARLRYKQGRFEEALRLCDAGIEAARRRPGPAMPWINYFERGRALEALGRRAEALADYRAAMTRAQNWRGQVLAGEWRNSAVDVRLSGVAEALRDLLLASDGRVGPERERMLEAFLVTEGTRSAGLNATRMEALLFARRGDDYGDALSKLRTRRGAEDATRRRLESIEAHAGLAKVETVVRSPEEARRQLVRIQANLGADECLFSIALGSSRSVMWIVTNRTFDWRLLPARETVNRTALAWKSSLLAGAAADAEAGRQLAKWLFGGLSPAARAKRDWVFSIDGGLFDAPLSALPVPDARSTLLIEEHSLRLVPAASFLYTDDVANSSLNPSLVALGDPIYNRADPRVPPELRPSRWRLLPPLQAGEELPRLAGSGQEIERVARLWREHGLPAQIFQGAGVSRAMESAMANRARVLHVATHVQVPERAGEPVLDEAGKGYGWLRRPGEVALALGLDERGQPRYLRTTEIAAMRFPGALVVLNGCNSGRGAALPGAGLMGLTRAWLAAGAAEVVATAWPTPDDNGVFFNSFYRDYVHGLERGRPSSARALRAAQLAALRSETWRAQPQYWAAYFSMGKE